MAYCFWKYNFILKCFNTDYCVLAWTRFSSHVPLGTQKNISLIMMLYFLLSHQQQLMVWHGEMQKCIMTSCRQQCDVTIWGTCILFSSPTWSTACMRFPDRWACKSDIRVSSKCGSVKGNFNVSEITHQNEKFPRRLWVRCFNKQLAERTKKELTPTLH